MRKGTRHGCNQCQMHMQCLMYMVRPANEASPFLTLSTCIHLTPCRITVTADDVHSRHARQTQQAQLPAHQSPLMFSLNPNPITFPTKSDNTCSVQVRGAKHCPEPATQVLHTVCNWMLLKSHALNTPVSMATSGVRSSGDSDLTWSSQEVIVLRASPPSPGKKLNGLFGAVPARRNTRLSKLTHMHCSLSIMAHSRLLQKMESVSHSCCLSS